MLLALQQHGLPLASSHPQRRRRRCHQDSVSGRQHTPSVQAQAWSPSASPAHASLASVASLDEAEEAELLHASELTLEELERQLSASTGPSSSRVAGGLHLKRPSPPLQPPSDAAAAARGGATPAKLATLAQQLRMRVRAVQDLVARCPQLLALTPDQLDTAIGRLASELSITSVRATFMVTKDPQLLFIGSQCQGESVQGQLPHSSSSSGLSSSSTSNNGSSSSLSSSDGSGHHSSSNGASSNGSFSSNGTVSHSLIEQRSSRHLHHNSAVWSAATNGRPDSHADTHPTTHIDIDTPPHTKTSTPTLHTNTATPTQTTTHTAPTSRHTKSRKGAQQRTEGGRGLPPPTSGPATRAAVLAHALGVSQQEVVRLATSTPSVLSRPPLPLAAKLKKLAQVLGGLPMTRVLHMAAEEPSYLTYRPPAVDRRIEAMRLLFRKPRHSIVGMLKRNPGLVFMSTRVLHNKLKVLQSILDKDARLVAPIAMRTPKLLSTNLDEVRECYELLEGLMGLPDKDYAFAMVCHAPGLLLEGKGRLVGRFRFLNHTFQGVPRWASQWRKLTPAQRADCMLVTPVTYSRLGFLAATSHQAPSLSLYDILMMARSDFGQRFPSFRPVPLVRQASPAANSAAAAAAASPSPQLVPTPSHQAHTALPSSHTAPVEQHAPSPSLATSPTSSSHAPHHTPSTPSQAHTPHSPTAPSLAHTALPSTPSHAPHSTQSWTQQLPHHYYGGELRPPAMADHDLTTTPAVQLPISPLQLSLQQHSNGSSREGDQSPHTPLHTHDQQPQSQQHHNQQTHLHSPVVSEQPALLNGHEHSSRRRRRKQPSVPLSGAAAPHSAAGTAHIQQEHTHTLQEQEHSHQLQPTQHAQQAADRHHAPSQQQPNARPPAQVKHTPSSSQPLSHPLPPPAMKRQPQQRQQHSAERPAFAVAASLTAVIDSGSGRNSSSRSSSIDSSRSTRRKLGSCDDEAGSLSTGLRL